MPDADIELIKGLYACFNARDAEGVVAAVTDDIAWANGMEGGHVHGRDGLRAYWQRQWAIVSPHVEPVAFTPAADGSLVVEVIQTVFDLDGKPLQGQSHGLKDKTVAHIFRIENGRVARFDIREAT